MQSSPEEPEVKELKANMLPNPKDRSQSGHLRVGLKNF